jgi:hypothetical protein
MEEVDEPFSWAFEQTCGLREVDELVLNDLTKSWRRPRLRRFWRSRRDF